MQVWKNLIYLLSLPVPGSENSGNIYSFEPGNSKTSVGFDPVDKHFIASATGSMELNIPKDAANEFIICLRVRYGEEGSAIFWADYYFRKK